jgi:type I restriction enzyme M protein
LRSSRSTCREEIAKREDNLDIFWLKEESLEDSDELPEPDILVADAVEKLETAVDELQEVLRVLEGENNG